MEDNVTQSVLLKEDTVNPLKLDHTDPVVIATVSAAVELTDLKEPHSDHASEIVSNILKAAHRLRGILNTYYAEFGLTDIRFSVLQIIKKADVQGCTQSELADQLQQSESSISTLVDRMRNSDLIYRLRSKSDRRKRVLILSDNGRIILDKVEACHNECMDKLLQPFQSDQKEELASLLHKLVDHLTFRNGQSDEDVNGILNMPDASESKPSAA